MIPSLRDEWDEYERYVAQIEQLRVHSAYWSIVVTLSLALGLALCLLVVSLPSPM